MNRRFAARFFQSPYTRSFLAGGLAALSLPPLYILPAFLALGYCIYHAAIATHWRRAALHLSLGAYGYFLISLYWISHSLLVGKADYIFMIPISFFGVPIIVSLFWLIFGMAGYWLARTPAARLFFIIAGLSLGEWGREFIATGFPWNAPGLVFLVHDLPAQLAAFGGQTWLNLLAFSAAGIWPLCYLLPQSKRLILISSVVVIALLSVMASHHYAQKPLSSDSPVKIVRLVQPHIPQAEKWQRENRPLHLAKMARLAIETITEPADMVILPESAFAGDYHLYEGLVGDVVAQISTPHQQKGGAGHVIIGALRFDEDDKLRNSALLYEAGKNKPVIYDKTHLVPFGEYVPWRFIPFIDAIAGPLDFHKGEAVYTVPLEGIGKSLILICYEAIFPQLVARADQRPDILINMTNDAWFGHTAGPYQHLAQTRMTAISYGIGMLRVANTGISAAFDAKGRTLVQIPLGQAGFRDVRVPSPMAASYFVKFGLALFFIFTSLLVICGLTLDRFHRNRQ